MRSDNILPMDTFIFFFVIWKETALFWLRKWTLCDRCRPAVDWRQPVISHQYRFECVTQLFHFRSCIQMKNTNYYFSLKERKSIRKMKGSITWKVSGDDVVKPHRHTIVVNAKMNWKEAKMELIPSEMIRAAVAQLMCRLLLRIQFDQWSQQKWCKCNRTVLFVRCAPFCEVRREQWHIQ